MLPGFRFLLAAIVLSTSVLVFGLGATLLLRAAHEEFASTPSWRAAPETRFAQQDDATKPTLSMLRVDEPPAAEQQASDHATAVVAAPTERKAPDDGAAPAEQAAPSSTPAEPEKVATLKPEDSSQPEPAKPEIPTPENKPAAAPPQTDAPTAVDETKTAATVQASPPAMETVPAASEEAVPAVSEQADVPGSPDANGISTKIATLGGPPVPIEAPTTKAASAKPGSSKPAGSKPVSATPDASAIKKRQQSQRTLQRRRIEARARLAAQAAQQPLDPFAQPLTTDRRR
jgi:hypothetical protein